MSKKAVLETLESYFKKNKVVRMPDLFLLLNTTSRMSVFRKLKKLDYISSYTHRGSYYTLPSLVKFDDVGIFNYTGIGFSRHGNLKETIICLVESSKSGMTQEELKKELKIRVHNSLLELIKSNKINRKRIEGAYLYVNANSVKANKQINNKIKEKITHYKTDLSDWTHIEVLLEIIRIAEVEINCLQITTRLNARGITITSEQIEQTLKCLGLKKTPDLKQ